ncbi:MAG: methylmalonyl-CoA mutase [Ignavibacteria bacterium CG_4_8_14_3_um_filter_37_9]|nr:methylmalonyl-CoA mutase family protein [Ignavibacteria bacterium]OIO14177.1 MAG: methylmalonyl-CoA mutase [Ignavibacteria bacterium CG1_02_37_35]PIS44019.1 MAG: methylmalonyl-CoA mutase [Ignavibacteria bacterium CG08_land_8_20_14_0_20_37_9]PIW98400.1 MAG: methylmalonyl-CoA mutase [Ignavibacteria bacterium CG_4_8_14_3_um_filter_37_9]PIX93738.1 MAG: methylmalonyl-CoA mutase [Ignavibacteria bacterium CG_4_10_14_3_um_filter_37_18]PJC59886.1 MAG: methylmalonyl-CoA mutase [Ignavibacteria bacteri
MPVSEEYKKLRDEYNQKVENSSTDDKNYTTVSGEPVKGLYGPDDLEKLNYLNDLNFPGEFPYTRGIHANGYRGKVWTMRQFAGFGSPEDTNERFHYLLKNGQTGLSVAFDLPTLMGLDADAELAQGEVGICGVSISSLKDMEILFNGIPLDKVSTSMTINSPAAMVFAFYLAVAKKQGVPFSKLRGTLQNDILKEYIAQKEFIYSPHPSMRIIVDMIEYCKNEVPQWNPVSVSGYHIREAGSTAVQELAYTLADGFAYIEACIERGMVVDDFAPRISFFFNAHLDFFEEIAKYRAARRIYARRMKEKYGAKNPRSWWLRFHSQTAGCSLTAQQPENNIVRTAFQAMAAVLGGTQSLHTNSMDETLALPSEKAVKIALRTQQLIAYETGVTNTVDPLGGSYFVEALTDKMEAQANKIFEEIDALGGVIPAIEMGYFQKNIADAAYRYQKEVERKEKFIVGVNEFVEENEKVDIPLLTVSPEVERVQHEQLEALKQSRNPKVVEKALEEIQLAAKENRNLMPVLLDAAEKYVSLGEMVEELRRVFGTYQETAVF